MPSRRSRAGAGHPGRGAQDVPEDGARSKGACTVRTNGRLTRTGAIPFVQCAMRAPVRTAIRSAWNWIHVTCLPPGCPTHVPHLSTPIERPPCSNADEGHVCRVALHGDREITDVDADATWSVRAMNRLPSQPGSRRRRELIRYRGQGRVRGGHHPNHHRIDTGAECIDLKPWLTRWRRVIDPSSR